MLEVSRPWEEHERQTKDTNPFRRDSSGTNPNRFHGQNLNPSNSRLNGNFTDRLISDAWNAMQAQRNRFIEAQQFSANPGQTPGPFETATPQGQTPGPFETVTPQDQTSNPHEIWSAIQQRSQEQKKHVKELAKEISGDEYRGGNIHRVNGVFWYDLDNPNLRERLKKQYPGAKIEVEEDRKMWAGESFFFYDSPSHQVHVERLDLDLGRSVQELEKLHKEYTQSLQELEFQRTGHQLEGNRVYPWRKGENGKILIAENQEGLDSAKRYGGEEVKSVALELTLKKLQKEINMQKSLIQEYATNILGQEYKNIILGRQRDNERITYYKDLSKFKEDHVVLQQDMNGIVKNKISVFDKGSPGSAEQSEILPLDKTTEVMKDWHERLSEEATKLYKDLTGIEVASKEAHAHKFEGKLYITGNRELQVEDLAKRGVEMSRRELKIRIEDGQVEKVALNPALGELKKEKIQELGKIARQRKTDIRKLHKDMFGKDVKPKDACGYVVEVKDSKLKKALGMKDTEKEKFFTVDELNALTKHYKPSRTKNKKYDNQVAKIAKMVPGDQSRELDLRGGKIEVRRVGLDQTQRELEKKQEEIDNRTAKLTNGTDVYGYRVIKVVDNKGGKLGKIKQDTIEVVTDRPKAQDKVQEDNSLEAEDNKDLNYLKIGEKIKYSSKDGDGSYIEYQRIGSHEVMEELEGRDVCDTINNNTDQNNPSLLSQYYNAVMFTKAEPIHVGGDNDYGTWKTVYAAEVVEEVKGKVERKLMFAKDEKSMRAKFPGKHIERLSKDEAKKRLEKLIEDRKAPSEVHGAMEDKIIEAFKKKYPNEVDWTKAKDKDGNPIKPHVSLKCQDLDKFYVFEREDGLCYYGRSLYAAAEHLNLRAANQAYGRSLYTAAEHLNLVPKYLKKLEIGQEGWYRTNYDRHNGKIWKPWTYHRFTKDAVEPLMCKVTRRELNSDERKKLEQGIKRGEIEVVLPETMYLYQDKKSGALTITDDQEEYGKNLTDYKLVKEVYGKDISDNMKKPDLPDTPQTRVDMVNGLEDDEMAKMCDDYEKSLEDGDNLRESLISSLENGGQDGVPRAETERILGSVQELTKNLPEDLQNDAPFVKEFTEAIKSYLTSRKEFEAIKDDDGDPNDKLKGAKKVYSALQGIENILSEKITV